MRYAIFFTALLALGCAPLSAQRMDEAASARVRNDCRLAAQVIETGHPHPRWRWAVEHIGICSESGPPALAALWRALPGDTARVEEAIEATGRIRDQRLYDEAVATLRATGRPAVVRVGAMRLLMRYVQPSQDYPFSALEPGERVRIATGVGKLNASVQVSGSRPLPDSLTSQVLALFQEIAADDREPVVAHAAARLARTLALTLETRDR